MDATDATTLYAELDRRSAAVAEQVIAWRRHLHRHPELSNREGATAELIAGHLTSLGLDEVRTGIAGHGVVGVLRGGRPGGRVVALRADTDALPVADLCGTDFASSAVDRDYPGGPFPVSHACGHDGHTAMLLGAATVLAGVREQLPGTVLFVFQPAEEGPPVTEAGGARQMLAEHALDDPEPTMVFGMHLTPHPKGHVGYRAGNQYAASCLVKITVTGRQVHGSTPGRASTRCRPPPRSSPASASSTASSTPTTRSPSPSATSRTSAASTSSASASPSGAPSAAPSRATWPTSSGA
ncbi:amidohydrolase [Kitasatospora saccharophila]|uniref:amidohydrolase n=1 Tax=Kitasatospora saccharophila TaxID=407973 RepID=UPI003632E4CC